MDLFRGSIAMYKVRSTLAGFTLIELLITIAIVAILSTLAYPSYQSFITKARRGEAVRELQDIAAGMERYYANNDSSYKDATPTRISGSADTEHGYYSLAVTLSNSSQSYTLSATATGFQANDSQCPSFTLTSTGKKGPAATVDQCW